MPPSKTEKQKIDPELLSQLLQAARLQDEQTSEAYEGRIEQIEAQEDELIQKYNNTIHLTTTPDPLQIQVVFAEAQQYISRTSEIYNQALKNISRLKASQNMIYHQLLPIMEGGSADVRQAQVYGCISTIGFLIGMEQGLIDICESTLKNLKNTEEMASRQLEAIRIDLQYFNSAEKLLPLVDGSREKLHGLG